MIGSVEERGTGTAGEGAASTDRALAWLRPRLEDGVPSDLAAAVRSCVRAADAGPDTPVPDLLAEAAVSELDRLTDRPADRETAVRLLAADAALTYAFEAAAESGDDVLDLADRVGLRGRIGERLAGLATEGEA